MRKDAIGLRKFYSRKLHSNKYYLADSLNSEWDIILQMKTGPEFTDLGFVEGIHWHINPDINVEYISENDKREVITYVKYTNKAHRSRLKFTEILITKYLTVLLLRPLARSMDCIDCHNRPSHNYNSPPVYFDKAMLTGEVSGDIPFIKRTAMGILRNTFTDKDTALMQIRDGIINYYKSDFGDYFEKNECQY